MRLGTVLGSIIILTLVWYSKSVTIICVGLPYLLVASLVLLIGFLVAMRLRVASKHGGDVRQIWYLELSANLSLVAATQLVVISLLNIWSFDGRSKSLTTLALSYLALICFLIATDRLLVLAGRPDQQDGVRPGKIINHLRSRRVIFWFLSVYPSSILAVAGIMLLARPKPYPLIFHPPEMCLLLSAVYSCTCSALVFQRYHGIDMRRRTHASAVAYLTLCLIFGGTIEFVVLRLLCIYLLTMAVIISIGASIFLISRARMAEPEGSVPPN
jgi:hypothetical protein